MNKKQTMIAAGIAATLGVTALTGCKNLSMNKQPHDERSEGRVLDDKKINETVQSRMKNEPVYKFESVEVNTFGGIVQLSGFVNSPDQKRRAEEIARHVPGVSQVVNALVLKPGPGYTSPSPTGQPTGERLSPPPTTNTNGGQTKPNN